jgi:hypothetical protein
LEWYQAYNDTKHARGTNLADANLKNVVDAMCGLVVLMSAQFYTNDFSGPDFLIAENGLTDTEHAIGGYFSVKFPDIPIEERYSLDISYTKQEKHKFDTFSYK